MNQSLLETRDLTKVYGGGFLQRGNQVVALQHFNLTIPASPAKIVTIAGESGSGKTTLANLVLGFVKLTSGQILYKGRDVSNMDKDETLNYRREVQAVFQDPYSVYNPFYRVKHIFDVVIKNFNLAPNEKDARDLIEDALCVVGMKGEDVLHKYPHQLSGGQRQRMMVARACMLKPSLIVADEPVSMIDASLRAMILEIMLRLRDEQGISFIYITHDLSTAFQIGDEMHLLYRGLTVEKGDTVKIIENPQHPYAIDLIASIPAVDNKWEGRIEAADDEATRYATSSSPVYVEVEPMHWVAQS
ncbi:MAG: ABC transporter ATP-binding protein [Chloroflexota bacterium]|nr:ABC transporter ATP-binding protein [Chloroflexota bacterium]